MNNHITHNKPNTSTQRKKPKFATSNIAVGFAAAARAKKVHDITIIVLLSFVILKSWVFSMRKKTNQL
jgi:hypothetical protein